MEGLRIPIPITLLLHFVIVTAVVGGVAPIPIPSRPVGFKYDVDEVGVGEGHVTGERKEEEEGRVTVEAFFDPLCPYSRDAWPSLKRTFRHYFPSVSVTVFLLPLPYHDNAFVVSRALTVANRMNSSLTYPLLEKFFSHQDMFSGERTRNMTRKAITKHIIQFAARAIGNNALWKVESGFADFDTNMQTRYSFKYSCSRGVMGTPTFFINGFPMPDDGTDLDFNKWKTIIDELIAGS